MADVFAKYGAEGVTGGGTTGTGAAYSEEYQRFKQAEYNSSYRFYESLCNISANIYSPKLKEKQNTEISNYLNIIHMSTTPSGVMSLAFLASLLTGVIALGVAIFIMLSYGMLYALLLPAIAAPVVYFVLAGQPKRMFTRWQASASDQIVLAVLYMILSMKRDGNLEHAVHFAAKEIPAPLSLDLMKILWQFQSGTYATVNEAIDAYLVVWKGKEDGFVDAVNLIEASRFSTSKEKAEKLLDKSVDVVLTGVQDNMTHFAHNLKGPMSTLYMLGIVLPVLMLVMLPLAGSFMGVGALPVVLIFDVILPALVYMIAKGVLAKRPGGVSRTGKDVFMQKLAARKAAATFIAVLIFVVLCTPFAIVMLGALSKYGLEKLSSVILFDASLGAMVLNTSILVVAGFGFSIAFYYWFICRGVLKLKEQVESIEDQFSAAIFQLGSRIEEGIPTEIAFGKVAAGLKGTNVGDMFGIIDQNIRTKGLSLKKSIFDREVGAAWMYPSALIRSVLRLVVEGAKKSLKAVSESLLILSQYLKNIHTVSERMKDLLADTISSMKMQAGFLIAVITSIVVGLSVLIVQILVQLSTAIGKISMVDGGGADYAAGAGDSAGMSAGLLNLFSPENAIAPYVFQVVVGVYVIIIVMIISYLLARVVYGQDEIRRKHLTASNLFKSVLIYCIVSFLASKLLGGLASKVVLNMGGAG